jgi:hypothetical protein
MRLLTFAELKPQKGIDYCRDHLRVKCELGTFPKPIELSPGKRIAWIESEIDKWIADLAAERDRPRAK